MRVRAITPIHVDTGELVRRQHRYDTLAPPGISVHLDDLGDGADVPRALETADDIRRSEALLRSQLRRTDPAAYDLVLPDCVLDPAVDADPDQPVPVLGILRLATHLLAATGQRFAAVARNRAIADELARKVAGYGLGDLLTDVRAPGLEVEQIPDDAAEQYVEFNEYTYITSPVRRGRHRGGGPRPRHRLRHWPGDSEGRTPGVPGHAAGVDISAPMLERARADAAEQGIANVGFEQGDAQVHRSRGGFDVAISRGGVMFFSDPVAGFANIRRALRPGGRLVFMGPQAGAPDSAYARATAALNPLMRGPSPAARGWVLVDPARIREVLGEAGFADVSVTPVKR